MTRPSRVRSYMGVAAGLLLLLGATSGAEDKSADTFYTEEEARSLFDEANAAYARGDAGQAIELYNRLVAHGRGGPDVLYNLGTAALSSGRLGEAAYALERALRAGDRSEDLQAQIKYLRSQQLDRVMGSEGEPLSARVARATPPDTTGMTFLVLYVVTAAVLLLLWLRPSVRKPWLLTLAFAFGGGTLLSGAIVAAHVYVDAKVSQAVVMRPVLPARPAPQMSAQPTFEMHAGLKVQVLERRADFARIKLGNGLTGWVEREGLAEL